MFSIITFINYIAQAFSTDEEPKTEVFGQREAAQVEKKVEKPKEEEIQKDAPKPVVPPTNPPKKVTGKPEDEEQE